jgi:3-methyladenine DNA glycosylase/8-oxoguanine DNA glycosylase
VILPLAAGAPFRTVANAAFRPRGPRYDAARIERWPVRALRGGPDGIAASFEARGPAVEIAILARGAASPDDVAWAMEAARGIAAVDDDPTEFFDLARRHPRVAELAEGSDCRLDRTPTVFESFTCAVIEQLVTSQEARAAIRRLYRDAGELIAGTEHRAPPTPTGVLAVPPWRLREMGIGVRRARTLREGARRGAALERLQRGDPAEAVQKLQSLPGVGPWTANLVAQKALAYADAVPVGDCHAFYVITEALTGEQGDDAAMVDALAPFRPHRARAARLLMRAQIVSRLQAGAPRRFPRVDPHRRQPWKY